MKDDDYAALRASLDQIASHHDEMGRWLGARARSLRDAGLPDEIVVILLARLADIVLPAENPMEEMLEALAREAKRRIEQESDEEGEA